MLVSIMRYYNNAASFVFIVFSWRFFKIFLVDVESIITLKGRKGKREGIGDRRKKTLPPFPFRAFLPLPHSLPHLFLRLSRKLPRSYLCPGFAQTFGSKIQDFCQTFQNNNFFPDSRLSNRWSIDLLKKTQEQSFFHDALQTYGRDWIRFKQNEKKNSLALAAA